MDKFYDNFLPAAQCPLLGCTPGKIWAVVSVVSALGAASNSWGTFTATVAWQFLMGLAMAYLCRSCRKGWAWALLTLLAFVPLISMGIVKLIGRAPTA